MPRIRTLKPEHRQHRKVGPLDHLTYRLWIGMILEADDAGRLVYDAEALRVLIFGYHPRVTRDFVERAARLLESTGLIQFYDAGGQAYVYFPSWRDHQRIDRPSESKLPDPKDSTNAREESYSRRESSLLIGREGKGSERNTTTTTSSSPRDEAAVAEWSQAEWGTPEALAYLYNAAAPDHLPAVETLSVKRKARARQLLRQFPEQAWWVDVFQEYARSRFLNGQIPSTNGHRTFRADFDWLLATGKQGTENAVRVHDGVYR